MPELSLPAPSLVVGRDHYMSRAKAWTSILSAQLTVTVQAATLRSLLESVTVSLTDQATGCYPVPNSSVKSFSGTIVLPKAYTQILDDTSVTFTATVGTNPVSITDDGDGALTGTNVTGTIDYATGAWTLVWSTGAPDTGSTITVDYTYYYVFGAEDIQGVWLYPAGDLRATFDGVTAPTAGTGIVLKGEEGLFLAAQPGLIGQMQLIAGGSVLLDVEVLM